MNDTSAEASVGECGHLVYNQQCPARQACVQGFFEGGDKGTCECVHVLGFYGEDCNEFTWRLVIAVLAIVCGTALWTTIAYRIIRKAVDRRSRRRKSGRVAALLYASLFMCACAVLLRLFKIVRIFWIQEFDGWYRFSAVISTAVVSQYFFFVVSVVPFLWLQLLLLRQRIGQNAHVRLVINMKRFATLLFICSPFIWLAVSASGAAQQVNAGAVAITILTTLLVPVFLAIARRVKKMLSLSARAPIRQHARDVDLMMHAFRWLFLAQMLVLPTMYCMLEPKTGSAGSVLGEIVQAIHAWGIYCCCCYADKVEIVLNKLKKNEVQPKPAPPPPVKPPQAPPGVLVLAGGPPRRQPTLYFMLSEQVDQESSGPSDVHHQLAFPPCAIAEKRSAGVAPAPQQLPPMVPQIPRLISDISSRASTERERSTFERGRSTVLEDLCEHDEVAANVYDSFFSVVTARHLRQDPA
uniref:Uncharacterized protein n=1 Tax=Phaeomonas parva TaxID=124430 RepID=A0A7S1Y110_9STRA|mmetsp:Transcript_8814/g.25614  ORF Transcript_8814/g.25614 Transcript_8814/m.25614 type:complete len:467 (+) Transcript_8814:345-1745(+)|eukprot:CAMPEP_0118886916 /NCGR_PEP_ID=MMETSP1163-20130328/24831_1 /TAXON_ID=124430 /ORGANISM="Phaeomonas parva, Strain CCMP2877" /LENGTH=466 /DNA_ID=CAMNT_0006825245 /DNA_START=290 /DNA_END=1690 /DNA_ORIENTATION=+